MRSVIVRCLAMNIGTILASIVVLLAYPRDRGFTISVGGYTRFLQGGAFLASLLLGVFDLLIVGYLTYHLVGTR